MPARQHNVYLFFMTIKKVAISIRDFMTHPTMLFLGFCMVFIGLYYSKAFVSIFDVGIFGVGVMYLSNRVDWRTAIWNRHTIPFILVFSLYLISALLSEDYFTALMRLKTNNYFLLIPLGISLLQPFSKQFLTRVFYTFVVITCASALIVSSEYLLNYSAYSEAYKTGKTIVTPILHIRYSYFISLALLIGIALFIERSRLEVYMRKSLPFIIGFLFLFLHILAVRTGLLSFYAGLGLFGVIAGRKYVRPKYMIGIASGLALILVLAINFVPSLKNKIQYSRYDIQQFMNKTGHYLYSDNLRLISIQNGLEVLKTAPMLGAGIGDIDAEMKRMYKAYYPDIPQDQQATPINQIVFSLATFGYLGGILFFILLFYPMSYREQFTDPKLLMIYGATFGSFMGDASIELQLGKVAFVTLVSLALWDIRTISKK